jgi:proline dehydrogenase
MGICVTNQLPPHTATIPGRFARHVVEPLVVAARDGLGHLLHVAPPALEQAVEIQKRGVLDRARDALEAGKVRRKVEIEVRKRRSNRRSNVMRVF